MLDVEYALTATARKAFRTTRFYGELYEAEPADVSEIPYVSDSDYHRASGLTSAPYLWRWLAVTGVMFLISAVCYAIRLRFASRRRSMLR